MNAAASIKFNPKNYAFDIGQHKDKKVIWISFPYDKELISQLKADTKAVHIILV